MDCGAEVGITGLLIAWPGMCLKLQLMTLTPETHKKISTNHGSLPNSDSNDRKRKWPTELETGSATTRPEIHRVAKSKYVEEHKAEVSTLIQKGTLWVNVFISTKKKPNLNLKAKLN